MHFSNNNKRSTSLYVSVSLSICLSLSLCVSVSLSVVFLSVGLSLSLFHAAIVFSQKAPAHSPGGSLTELHNERAT